MFSQERKGLMNFTEKVQLVQKKMKSYVCVGLDTDINRIPKSIIGKCAKRIVLFNRDIIEATAEYVCAFKFNSAFYEAAGVPGIEALMESISIVPQGVLKILDVKRGDIGNTAEQYATAAFERFSVDAATINPYLGMDSIKPFLNYKTKGVFVLCLTSNPGSNDFQQLTLSDGKPLYIAVAQKMQEYNLLGNLGLVVGATHPEELADIRAAAPDMPFLIPGIGAQHGNVEKTVRAGIGKNNAPIIINASRSIIYASSDSDFLKAAQVQCRKLRDEIHSIVEATFSKDTQ